MAEQEKASWQEQTHALVAVYSDEQKTEDVVKRLVDDDCRMELISVLARFHAEDDGTSGVYKLNIGERMEARGARGAFWGGLWGMLAGAAGMFFVPGVGAVAAAGYIVEALLGGAVVGVGAMSGSAALSHLAAAYHRAGVPEEKIKSLHTAVEEGKYVLMVRGTEAELEKWRKALESARPSELHDLSYRQTVEED